MGMGGQVAVLAGGEGPLGRAVTQEFLSRGAKVLVGWNSEEEWATARDLIPADCGGRIADMKADLTEEIQVADLIAKARQQFGSVDVLLHMVGLIRVGQPLWETDAEVFDKLLSVNLRSAFLCAKHAVKVMLEKNSGRIFFFPASVVLEPKAGFGAYAVSKGGLVTLTEALREELKDTAITVNSVMFSVLDTPKTRKMPDAQPEKYVSPAEVARLLASLCSERSSVLSGSVLKLYGKL